MRLIVAAGNLPIHLVVLGMKSHSHVFGVWVRKVALVRLLKAHQVMGCMTERTNIPLIHAHNSDKFVSSGVSSRVTCTLCEGYLDCSVMYDTQRYKKRLTLFNPYPRITLDRMTMDISSSTTCCMALAACFLLLEALLSRNDRRLRARKISLEGPERSMTPVVGSSPVTKCSADRSSVVILKHCRTMCPTFPRTDSRKIG